MLCLRGIISALTFKYFDRSSLQKSHSRVRNTQTSNGLNALSHDQKHKWTQYKHYELHKPFQNDTNYKKIQWGKLRLLPTAYTTTLWLHTPYTTHALSQFLLGFNVKANCGCVARVGLNRKRLQKMSVVGKHERGPTLVWEIRRCLAIQISPESLGKAHWCRRSLKSFV